MKDVKGFRVPARRPGYAGPTTSEEERERESPSIPGLSRSRSSSLVVPPKAAAWPRTSNHLCLHVFMVIAFDLRFSKER